MEVMHIFGIIFLTFISIPSPALNFKSREIPMPNGLKLKLETFITWSREIWWEKVWSVHPENALQVLVVTNWAFKNGWKARPSGNMHSWSPLTLTPPMENHHQSYSNSWRNPGNGFKKNVILIHTDKLRKMEIISRDPGNFSFWAEPGIFMDDVLAKLEENQMGFLHYPAMGELTLGGVLAVGGHGGGLFSKGENLARGHTYGSLSNLIISVEAVVYDEMLGEYRLRKFYRSDPEMKALMVNLGRTFITNVTMRAGPLRYLRCQSIFDITDDEFFSSDPENDHSDYNDQLQFQIRSASNLVREYGTVEIIQWPFTKRSWIKVWSIMEMTNNNNTNTKGCPDPSRGIIKTDHPYNYKFSYKLNPHLAEKMQRINEIPSLNFLAQPFSQLSFHWANYDIQARRNEDICGASKNVLLYAGARTIRYHISGHAILVRRDHLQRAVSAIYRIFTTLVEEYRQQRKFPMNGPIQIRVTGVDNFEDVGIVGAESPSISPSSPVKGRPELNTVVWFNTNTFPGTPHRLKFLKQLESGFLSVFDGDWAVLRPEWSKGWGYTDENGWSNETFLKKMIPQSFGTNWDDFRAVFKSLDAGVFTNEFITQLFI